MVEKLSERLEALTEKVGVTTEGAYLDRLANGTVIALECAEFIRDHGPALLQVVRAVEGAWMPIETAPKDGTSIDVWNGERIPDVSWCRPDGGSIDYKDWCASVAEVHGYSVGWCMENIYPHPTHWMPKPSPPAIVPVGQEGR